MNRADFFLTLCKWLACAAVADWLIGRTFMRAAIHMPKSPFLLTLYQLLGVIGQFAFVLTGVLALVTFGVLAWQQRFKWYGALSCVLGALAGASLVFVVIPPTGVWSIAYHLLFLAAIVFIGAQAQRTHNLQLWLVPALAVACSEMYVLAAAFNNAVGAGAALPGTLWFNLGELFVAAGGILLWWLLARRRATRRLYLLALAPTLLFSASFWANPAMTGIMAMWSMGLSLYLPWIVYALSIWGAGVTFLVFLRDDVRVSIALVLLVAGGFAPQMSAHAFLSLLGLWLLAIANPNPLAARAPNLRAAPVTQT